MEAYETQLYELAEVEKNLKQSSNYLWEYGQSFFRFFLSKRLQKDEMDTPASAVIDGTRARVSSILKR